MLVPMARVEIIGPKNRFFEVVTLLHEQGLAALTQPRIAKAAGVSQSHLTYYFPKVGS